MVVNNFQNTLV